MKKSAQVTLTVVAAVGLASCGRGRRDPCEASSFNEMACQDSVRSGGYYWGGSWYPMIYHYPYPYYYDRYRGHLSRGGSVVAAPSSSYSHPGASVTRGGFGSTGAGGAGHGAGE